MTSDATPDTPVDPREVIDLIRRAQDEADATLPAPIASALVHHMWQLWQGVSTHGKDAAVALAHEVLAFCAATEGQEGSLRSRASGTPAITPETATAIYLAVHVREVQRATFEGGRITTADIADVFREHGVEVTS